MRELDAPERGQVREGAAEPCCIIAKVSKTYVALLTQPPPKFVRLVIVITDNGADALTNLAPVRRLPNDFPEMPYELLCRVPACFASEASVFPSILVRNARLVNVHEWEHLIATFADPLTAAPPARVALRGLR